jgi:outer membrane protein assembly factor BamB
VKYDTTLLVVARGRTPLLFDARALQEVHFAQVVGRALVVAAWRNGYAKDSGGKTGNIAAFSLENGKLIWSSEPLVTTSAGFVVTKDHIVTGYGFTAEPDNLFALELATGKTIQKLQLRSGPDFILRKDDRIFVRTYDSEAVFRMSPNPGPAPSADLAVATNGARAMSSDASCLVMSAVAAIDARDPRALQAAIDRLKASGAPSDVAGAFDGVQAFLEQQSGGAKAIDLTTATARKIAPPPWAYKLVRAATAPVTDKPKLVDKGSRPADPARGVRARGGRVDPTKPFFLAPVDRGQLPPGARPDIPSTYGLLSLSAAIPQGDRLILIYGGRYVAVVKGSDTEAIFDFEAWLKPPRVSAEWKEFAVSDVTFAMAEGDVLFVGNGGGSYAREMGGTKGFMSAIDLKTGELLWRSQPLVHGGGAFAFFKGFIMTGYGFTDEPDNVFLLRKDNGQVVHKVPVKSAPGSITLSGNVATVETYDAVHEIEIRE